MFASRLSEMNDKLTYSEKLIANLILSNYTNFEVMTSAEIAKTVGVGQATVIRFSKKLGYPTFKSMILDITTDSSFYSSNEVREDESLRDIMVKMKNLYEISIDDAMANNSDETIERAVRAIEHAKTVFCYGVRSSSALAGLLYYRLLEVGVNVVKANEFIEGISIARNLGANDVLFIVSISGETQEAVALAKNAKERNAQIISITGSQHNTIQQLSTVAMKSAEFDMRAHRFNLINRCSQLYLIDCIFMKLWKDNEDVYIRQIEEFSSSFNESTIKLSGMDITHRL